MLEYKATEAKRTLAHLLDTVQDGPVLITRRGEPAAIMVTPQDYESVVQGKPMRHELNLYSALDSNAASTRARL